MRLQRALARAGVASRREAERLIEAGKVRVDGKPATIGMKVDPERQKITVGGRTVKLKERRWLAFHKPLGVVTTAADEQGRRAVFDFIRDPAGLTYVGRLDVNTTGLLLLTTTATRCTGSRTRAIACRAAIPPSCTAVPPTS